MQTSTPPPAPVDVQTEYEQSQLQALENELAGRPDGGTIDADALLCRCDRPLPDDVKRKIALFCNVPVEAVIEERDKEFSVYEVPISLVEHGLDELIVRKLDLPAGAGIRFVFPHAPMQPVTIIGGYVMRDWYDIV